MTPSDAAVEAAARAMAGGDDGFRTARDYDDLAPAVQGLWLRRARLALDAAAAVPPDPDAPAIPWTMTNDQAVRVHKRVRHLRSWGVREAVQAAVEEGIVAPT